MNYSVHDPETGRLQDVVCRKSDADNSYLVYLGDRVVGKIFRPYGGSSGWVPVVMTHPVRSFKSVDGLRSRRDAIDYIMQASGIHPHGAGPLNTEGIRSTLKVYGLEDHLDLVKAMNKRMWGSEFVESDLLNHTINALQAVTDSGID